MRKVVLIGSTGQLGSDIRRVWGQGTLVPVTHQDVDVRDAAGVLALLEEHKPDVVINTAALNNTELCESDPDTAFAVNALGPWNLARACRETGASLVQISTDYVFSGEASTPYLEDALPQPTNVAGASKLAGEHLVRAVLERHYVVRVAGLFGISGASGKGGNFVETMLRLAREGKEIRVVDDQRLSPTSTRDLAKKLLWLQETDRYGTYHMTNKGDCTWYEFARAIFETVGVKPNFGPTTTAAFGSRIRRPAYSVLGHGVLQTMGADDLPHWREALREYLQLKGWI